MRSPEPGIAEPLLPPDECCRKVVGQLYEVRRGDTALALTRAWHGFGVVSAAAELLALDGYPGHAMLWDGAQVLLHASVQILRGAPSLPADERPVTVTVTGSPGSAPDPAFVYGLHRGVYEVTLALASLLRQAQRDAVDRADRQAWG